VPRAFAGDDSGSNPVFDMEFVEVALGPGLRMSSSTRGTIGRGTKVFVRMLVVSTTWKRPAEAGIGHQASHLTGVPGGLDGRLGVSASRSTTWTPAPYWRRGSTRPRADL